MNIRFTGINELERHITNVSEQLTNGQLLLSIGYKIETHAKENWGHGKHEGGYPNIQSDRLRTSINTQLSPDKTECIVGTNVEYANAVEFGHFIAVGAGSRGGLMKNTRMSPFSMGVRQTKAYPFLFPALTQVQETGELDGVMVDYSNAIERAWIQ